MNLPQAKTPHGQESAQRQIAATDKATDALVYEHYDLTEYEISRRKRTEMIHRTIREVPRKNQLFRLRPTEAR